MRNQDLPSVFRHLRSENKKWRIPIVTQFARERKKDPFKVLISTIISLRTKDDVTGQASNRLWAIAQTPQSMAQTPLSKIKKAIYPAGFYNTKAGVIKDIARVLLNEHNGIVPDNIDQLIKMKGVGRKTANLVVIEAYGKPGICVDTHVHRITNRWGYVNTKTPDETEIALRKKLPKRYWAEINYLLVGYGQNLCKPISPLCSRCSIAKACSRKGVGISR